MSNDNKPNKNNIKIVSGNETRICPQKPVVPIKMVFPSNGFDSNIGNMPILSGKQVVEEKHFVEENKK